MYYWVSSVPPFVISGKTSHLYEVCQFLRIAGVCLDLSQWDLIRGGDSLATLEALSSAISAGFGRASLDQMGGETVAEEDVVGLNFGSERLHYSVENYREGKDAVWWVDEEILVQRST